VTREKGKKPERARMGPGFSGDDFMFCPPHTAIHANEPLLSSPGTPVRCLCQCCHSRFRGNPLVSLWLPILAERHGEGIEVGQLISLEQGKGSEGTRDSRRFWRTKGHYPLLSAFCLNSGKLTRSFGSVANLHVLPGTQSQPGNPDSVP
jgi:hypothetical protein